jgi:hypothetical protein
MRNQLILFITLSISLLPLRGKTQNIFQFEKCDSIPIINFNEINKKISSVYDITIIIFRGEGTNSNSDKITPLIEKIDNYDHSLINIECYELTSTLGSNSCGFKYNLNNAVNSIKGVPPFACITGIDTILMSNLQHDFNLVPLKHDSKFLTFNVSYTNDRDFFKLLNNFLKYYTSGYLLKKQQNFASANSKLNNKLHKNELGINMYLGTFNQQLKRNITMNSSANQSNESLPILTGISFTYEHYFYKNLYLKPGIDLIFLSSSNYCKYINNLPNYNPVYVSKQDPIARSNSLNTGISLLIGK